MVGVDIGANSIRGVEVQASTSAKPTIVRMGEVPLPETAVRKGEVVEVGTVATALKRLWTTAGFKSKDVVLGMGGQRVFARDFAVPLAPMALIRESLPFQAQDMLPVPINDVILDFYPISTEEGENGPQVSGLLVAGVKEAINANVQAVVSAGLRPVHVDLIPFALCRALAPRRSARGREAIVAIGAATTNVVVVVDGVPKFVRIIPNGGDDITRTMVSRLGWNPDQAEHAKRAIGLGMNSVSPDERPIIEIIYEVAGELLGNIRNTLSYYANARPSEPIERVLFTGRGALLGGLANALADVTRLPVGIADPLNSYALPRPKDAPGYTHEQLNGYTTAFGLALGRHA
ncbi:type IV pilus assembly protein PilM [Protaetiibacter larvae]|uniref:type IV pilus assembly protein PilM n=1 Tax=Protaetiibacter larvae TaxID=2592654 RepID=UPI00143D4BF3|nr:type IV pilus assembly protein PilM [Protaetiibacter larvae]